ncbi:hypothetical protein [Tepidiphilus sp. J10]|uniref:hypothetical protein n=1 Tax=Tepidiphilus sp. J10 TaxID=2502185 RepID=UPI00115D820D|nr:hypothetical protein [Tepidiphilus sp. J10]
MDTAILAAIISASGTVLAALIGGASVLVVALHRRKIIALAKSVEFYHALETEWLRESLRKELGQEPTDGQINHRRGQKRRSLMGSIDHAVLTARQAAAIRARYFG